MAFLNQKEDVIDLQLTQYGKYLVSKGKFKPVYYAFYDDDIIYDQRYATGSDLEVQKDIEDRIFNKTPRPATQYLFHSVEDFRKTNDIKRTDPTTAANAIFRKNLSFGLEEKIQHTQEKHFALSAPLGRSDLLEEYAPAFDIKMIRGEISSSITTISGSIVDNVDQVYSIQRIPQINLKDVIFYTTVKTVTGDDDDLEFELIGAEPFEDGTYIGVTDDYLLMRVEEENVPMSMENFDVEVYVTDISGNIESPLYFKEGSQNKGIKNGILLDPPEPDRDFLHELTPIEPGGNPQVGSQRLADVDQVEYFFNFRTDDSIRFSQLEHRRKKQEKGG